MTTIQNPIELTLYLVGNDEEEALGGLPFDSLESADSYANDEGGNIYSIRTYMDPSTMTIEKEETP